LAWRVGAALLLALCVSCSGCGLFTLSLLDVGLRCEIPVSKTADGSAPARARVDPARGRLCLGYTVKVVEWSRLGHGEPECRGPEVGREERWLSLNGRVLCGGKAPFCQEEGRNVFKLSEEFAAGAVARKPKWNICKLEPRAAGAAADDAQPHVRMSFDKNRQGGPPRQDEDVVLLRCFMDFPETEGPDEVDLALPRRYYRTPAGWAAQSLLPVTVTLDVVTMPVQIIFLLCTKWVM
jgi:hypothetical protein